MTTLLNATVLYHFAQCCIIQPSIGKSTHVIQLLLLLLVVAPVSFLVAVVVAAFLVLVVVAAFLVLVLVAAFLVVFAVPVVAVVAVAAVAVAAACHLLKAIWSTPASLSLCE